jgi:CHAT domain-containing protein
MLDPGLLAGLALAGANETPATGRPDGLLTAFELQLTDLSGVELAVLSACETGLGESFSGEGLLSLQRSLHVAGVRTTVASLWAVSDGATAQLMARFYANLWERRMTKVEALREAQLWMLREATRATGDTRGLVLDEYPEDQATGRLPPVYWAAFVLSGDWR